MSSTAVVVFTRDLRVTDHLALTTACARHDRVVPLFVLDDAILASRFNRPNRTGFLLESLHDLDRVLRGLGARLVVRRGPWVDTVLAVARAAGAEAVHVSSDVSAYARAREASLAGECAAAGLRFEPAPGVTVVEPGTLTPAGEDHYRVFTPYYRRWQATDLRPVAPAPARVRLPDGVEPGDLPTLEELVSGVRAPSAPAGGSTEARRRLDRWLGAGDRGMSGYEAHHDDLASHSTSRLAPYLHFGCLSPREVVAAAIGRPGSEPFLRQLCWRDFFHQILAARPEAAWRDYRPRGDRGRDDPAGLQAWKEGLTGFPVVDAAMRQLAQEGFVPNRARMIVASFLTKDLSIDWRDGARHFLDLLVDGDIANNNLNWQWVAGTGTDTNPHRVFNPTVQGRRFDPDGEYVRRYVPELSALRGTAVHDPQPAVRRAYGYPDPIVDHHTAIAAYRARPRPATPRR
jgi:deoxyribodipyrimidine photo-lyase